MRTSLILAYRYALSLIVFLGEAINSNTYSKSFLTKIIYMTPTFFHHKTVRLESPIAFVGMYCTSTYNM